MPRPDRASYVRVLFALSLLVSGLILFLPGPGGAEHFRYEDKVVHAMIFAAPTALGWLGAIRPRLLVPGLIAYAAASEAIQGILLPTRSGSVRDLVADLAGIGLGAAIGALVRGERNTRQ